MVVRISNILVTVFVLSIIPSAMGTITITDTYYAVDAAVQVLPFEPDLQHDEGPSPIETDAAYSGEEGTAAAHAAADMLNLSAWSVVDLVEDQVGAAVGSAGSALIGITSDTLWGLDIESVFSIEQTANNSAGVTAEALVTDMDGTEVYKYVLTNDGPFGNTVIEPGTYNVSLYITSFSIVPEPFGSPEYASSSISMNAQMTVIPEPCTVLFGLVGSGFVILRRRRRQGF